MIYLQNRIYFLVFTIATHLAVLSLIIGMEYHLAKVKLTSIIKNQLACARLKYSLSTP